MFKKIPLLLALALHSCCGGIAVAALSEPDKAVLSATEVLPNGGFEHARATWVYDFGTLSLVTSATAGLDSFGKSYGIWNSSSAGQTLCNTSAVPAAHKSNNGVTSVWIQTPSGTATHKLRVTNGTDTLAEADVISSTTWTRVSTPAYVFPSSGNIVTCLVSVAADEPSINVDNFSTDLYKGLQEVLNEDGWENYSGTVTTNSGTMTNATVVLKKRRNGPHLELTGSITFTGAPGTWSRPQIPLPSGLAVDTSKVATTSVGSTRGFASFLDTGTRVYKGTSEYSYSVGAILLRGYATNTSDTSTTDPAFDQDITQAFPHTWASTDVMEFYITGIPIVGWSESSSAFTAATSAMSWSGYHSSDCTFDGTSASAADFANDSSCTFTEAYNKNFGTVTSYQTSGNNNAGIVFTPGRTGTIEICPTAMFYHSSDNISSRIHLTDGSNNVITHWNYTSASSRRVTISGCYTREVSQGVSTTIKFRATTPSATLSLNGLDRSIHWNLKYIDQVLPAPLIKQAVVSPYDGVLNIVVAEIECDGSSQIVKQFALTGNGIASVGNISTGVCAVTLANGAFSQTPICLDNHNQNISGTNTRTITSTGVSSTSVNIDCSTGAADCTSYIANLFCIGPK